MNPGISFNSRINPNVALPRGWTLGALLTLDSGTLRMKCHPRRSKQKISRRVQKVRPRAVRVASNAKEIKSLGIPEVDELTNMLKRVYS